MFVEKAFIFPIQKERVQPLVSFVLIAFDRPCLFALVQALVLY